jgi:hypothetical protein
LCFHYEKPVVPHFVWLSAEITTSAPYRNNEVTSLTSIVLVTIVSIEAVQLFVQGFGAVAGAVTKDNADGLAKRVRVHFDARVLCVA